MLTLESFWGRVVLACYTGMRDDLRLCGPGGSTSNPQQKGIGMVRADQLAVAVSEKISNHSSIEKKNQQKSPAFLLDFLQAWYLIVPCIETIYKIRGVADFSAVGAKH
ncbi:hypothetical protein PoB_002257700 [Plakobranchus ocellatus]|uniref:Uncharacterized protein n=1 Tax=Plakobranchus ocellatus TaxID=259542 RepID=A0AAV3ZN36_9GAST|nr:hypothetical protein PoB_002257700 [Plakobranchus ocellatus]